MMQISTLPDLIKFWKSNFYILILLTRQFNLYHDNAV